MVGQVRPERRQPLERDAMPETASTPPTEQPFAHNLGDREIRHAIVRELDPLRVDFSEALEAPRRSKLSVGEDA
jgi:hypothetical protein